MEDGKITVAHDLVLSSQLTRAQFLASQIGHDAQQSITNSPHAAYRFSTTLAFGLECILHIHFVAETLRDIYIYPLWTTPSTQWTDSRESIEQENKAYNDALLEHVLGAPPYRFPWGEITSICDQKGGSSGIIVRYY